MNSLYTIHSLIRMGCPFTPTELSQFFGPAIELSGTALLNRTLPLEFHIWFLNHSLVLLPEVNLNRIIPNSEFQTCIQTELKRSDYDLLAKPFARTIRLFVILSTYKQANPNWTPEQNINYYRYHSHLNWRYYDNIYTELYQKLIRLLLRV